MSEIEDRTLVSPASQALPAGAQVEEFVIERVLGSGGFGITYLAKDSRLGRQVVIKENLPAQFCWREPSSLTVRPRHTEGEDAANFAWSLENFEREAATLASLDHPGIVRVLRSFEAFGTAFFTMPFVEGTALDEQIAHRKEKGARFTEEELSGLLWRMLDALEYLHARGIYHRDIKPGNILITQEGEPILIDFGSARQRLSERSLTVIESPGYTPFEQLQSRGKIGPWSDLYALGGTLYKAITGETPPKAADRIMDDPLEPLSLRAGLSGFYSKSFLQSIDRAMAPRFEDRFPDAKQWRDRLREGDSAKPARADNAPTPEVVAVKGEGRDGADGPIPRAAGVAPPLWRLPVKKAVARMAPPTSGPRNSGRAGGPSKRGNKVPLGVVVAIVGFAVLGLGWLLVSVSKEEGKQPVPPAVAAAGAGATSMEGSDAGEVRTFGGIDFVWCPAGEFQMGSPASEEGRKDGEKQHRVTLTRGFWMAKTECTQGQWKAVMGENPSHFTGSDDLPVEQVSWADAREYVQKLGTGLRLRAGWKVGLPTEAQWEYACRAGTSTPFSFGRTLNGEEANCVGTNPYGTTVKGPYLQKTTKVGSYPANAWGLVDMHGNVWEWCQDFYDADYYADGQRDPVGPVTGSHRVDRGGGWTRVASLCRSANRSAPPPGARSGDLGFRVAVSFTDVLGLDRDETQGVPSPTSALQPAARITEGKSAGEVRRGDLDEAIAIRKEIQKLETGTFDTTASEPSKAADKDWFVGTRWKVTSRPK